MMDAPQVSVIVCAYTLQRWDELVAAVASLERQTVPPTQIVVVSDHNDDLLARARAQLPAATVVGNREARGLSGARNSGVAAAWGDIVAFLDDDAVALPNWLECLGAHYRDPGVIGAGGAIVPLWAEGRPAWFPDEFDWVVGCTYRGMPARATSVRNLIGANMSFRREVFDTVGGFHTAIGRVGTLPAGCEETELCIRVRQRWPRRQLRYEPRAVVGHRVPAGRGRWAYFRSRCYAEGRSKALVARLVGAQDGLSSEREYTRRVLPRGVARGLADALLRGEAAGLGRAGAIVAGLAVTTGGYLTGTIVATPTGRRMRATKATALGTGG